MVREWATSSILRLPDRRGGSGKRNMFLELEREIHMLHTANFFVAYLFLPWSISGAQKRLMRFFICRKFGNDTRGTTRNPAASLKIMHRIGNGQRTTQVVGTKQLDLPDVLIYSILLLPGASTYWEWKARNLILGCCPRDTRNVEAIYSFITFALL
jgi:hypothetical protein